MIIFVMMTNRYTNFFDLLQVFLHNLEGFDSHLIVSAVNNKLLDICDKEKCNVDIYDYTNDSDTDCSKASVKTIKPGGKIWWKEFDPVEKDSDKSFEDREYTNDIAAAKHPVLGEQSISWEITAVPSNTQKLKMLTFGHFEFADSLSFQKGSLDNLIKKHKETMNGDVMEVLGKSDLVVKNTKFSRERYNMCTKKGVMAYGLVSSVEALENVDKFPSVEDFERLGEPVSNEAQQRGVDTYEEYGFANMLKYYEFYCELDVILLLEILVAFKDRAHKNLGLSIDKYFSLPQFALDACLKLTKANIELIVEKEMYNFVQSALRGGMCVASKRLDLTKAGMEFVKKNDEKIDKASVKAWEDANKKLEETVGEKVILDTDMNNLYGSAQTLLLPLRGYQWFLPDELLKIKQFCDTKSANVGIKQFREKEAKKQNQNLRSCMQIQPNYRACECSDQSYCPNKIKFNNSNFFPPTATVDKTGMIKNLEEGEEWSGFIEVDLEYCKNLHKLHDRFPVAPENITITGDECSIKSREILHRLGRVPDNHEATKLITHLEDRKNYIVHTDNLELYLSLG